MSEAHKPLPNQDIPNLSVAELLASHKDIVARYNKYIDFRATFPGKPEEAAPELSKEETARGQALWRELLRRALADDAEAMAAVAGELGPSVVNEIGVIPKETLKELLEDDGGGL